MQIWRPLDLLYRDDGDHRLRCSSSRSRARSRKRQRARALFRHCAFLDTEICFYSESCVNELRRLQNDFRIRADDA
jgi:hypothetical protein